jgi:hypothetical protein
MRAAAHLIDAATDHPESVLCALHYGKAFAVLLA